MTRAEEIEAQTSIRRRLLANGYVPLANKDKMCILPGWSKLTVDEALIDQWSREWKWRGTGVRIEGGLVAIDFDIDDTDALDAITEALPEAIWDKLRLAPVRRGKGAKEAWFCRLEEGEQPFYRLASASFTAPGDEETVHRVEIFADAGGGRQFGAYGAHTIEGGDVVVAYRWDRGRGLADIPLAELPALTRAELAEVADTTTRVLKELGWASQLAFKAGFSTSGIIYDLEDTMVFETRDHGPVDLDELTRLAEMDGSVRLSASWLEGPGAVNPTRCIASIHPGDGKLQILETQAFERHRPKSMVPMTPNEDAVARMREATERGSLFGRRQRREAAPVVAEAAPTGEEVADELGTIVTALVGTVAYCPSEQRCVLPIDGKPEAAMSLANFKTLMLPHSVQVQGPRGGVTTINPATIWAADPRRVVVGGYRFRPDRADERLVYDGGERYINLYREPEWPTVSEAQRVAVRQVFEGLLAHLVADEAARAWFRMWLASKVQAPWMPNCAVLMVAARQGAGRGTLFDMMRVAVGPDYHRSIGSTELMGGGSQGQFNGWAERAVLVTVDEVMAGADGSMNMQWKRDEAYERIKQLVDPRQRVMEIRRKYGMNNSQEVFFSLLMATNHMNALPLERSDRRIAVLIQPDVTLRENPDLDAMVTAARGTMGFDLAFGAALRAHLMTVEVDAKALLNAPELDGGRALMREANEGDRDELLREALAGIRGDFITNEALRARVLRLMQAGGEGDHLRGAWSHAQSVLARHNDFGWRKMPLRQKYGAEGQLKNSTIYYRVEGAGLKAWEHMGRGERVLALGEGVTGAPDLSGGVTGGGKPAVTRHTH